MIDQKIGASPLYEVRRLPLFNSTPLRQREITAMARRATVRVALSLRNIHCNAGI